ncbi:unnamed protein product, partial [Brachionus calyciflorus]
MSTTKLELNFPPKKIAFYFFPDLKFNSLTKKKEGYYKICSNNNKRTDCKGNYTNFKRHAETMHVKLLNEFLKTSIPNLGFEPITNQLKISSYDSNHEKQVKFKNSVIEDLIVDCGLPLSIVDKPGFIRFANKECNSKLSKIYRKTITNHDIPAKCILLKPRIREIIQKCNKLCVSAHLLDEAFKPHSFLLEFCIIIGKKTGEKIALKYMIVIEEYQIENKVIKATTDSGANMKKSFEKDIQNLIEEHNDNVGFKLKLEDDDEVDIEVNCENENENEELIIEKDDETSEDMIRFINNFNNKKITPIDRLASSASHQCPGLAESIADNFKLTIPTPGGLRWDSHYRCIFAINILDKNQLNKFLIDYANLIILPTEKEKIEEFLSIMQAFYTASKLSQASERPTISIVVPCIVSIYLHLKKILLTSKYFDEFIKKSIKNLLNRYGAIFIKLGIETDLIEKKNSSNFSDNCYVLSTLLDPRYKDKWINY